MNGSPVLYSLTLQRPSAITATAVGQFAEGSKAQQIALARGSWLELMRPDPDLGKLVLLYRVNVMATIRGLASFKISGSGHDYLLMSSDSGKISVLGWDAKLNKFLLLKQESFGKSGIRRTIPGEFLACDPRGRAAMVAAVEKSRLVYVLNRSENGDVTVSSPLESSSPRSICYAVTGVDVGYENPTFAALEAQYNEEHSGPPVAEKRVVLYELDLGLNHIIHKWSRQVDFSSGLLVTLPGGNEGPSGLVVCSDNKVSYLHPNQAPLEVHFPAPDKSPNYVISAVMHRMGDVFFVLLQDVHGVLFKLNFDLIEVNTGARWGGRKTVAKMELQQFGAASPSVSMNVFKDGFLFCGAESGDHLLYQFNTLGDEDDVPKYSSENYEKVLYQQLDLENITVVESLPSISPVLSSTVLNLRKDETPQIYAACGRDQLSSLRVIEYGLEVTELINSPLPAEPVAVFTTKVASSDQFDQYIVLSFANETLVLSIGDEVAEVSDSGLVKGVSTVAVQQIGNSSLVQVHAKGVVHITKDKAVTEWKPPSGTTIVMCSANNSQVLLALSSHEIVYFESDSEGMLIEYSKREKMPAEITALGVGPVPKGRVRSLFGAVGCKDETVRLLSLDLGNPLETLSVQGLSAPASSLEILQHVSDLCVHIGLKNGVYLVTSLDTATGELSDTKTRFIGPAPVKICRTWTAEDDMQTVLALTTRPWISNSFSKGLEVVPLSYPHLRSAAPFSSPDYPKGTVAVSKGSLCILQIERSKENVHQRCIGVDLTPRKMVTNSLTAYFYTLCTGHSDGIVRTEIKVMDAVKTESVLGSLTLSENYAGLAICNCRFQSKGKEYLVVSTAKGLVQKPGSAASFESAEIQVFEYSGSPFGTTLELVHSTEVPTMAHVIVGFKGMLLAGIGNTLIMFDMGKKQLLKKAVCLLSTFTDIRALAVMKDRIVVGDARRSIMFVRYENEKATENEAGALVLTPLADDPVARGVTCVALLDYDTAVVGDRNGNVAVLRCPKPLSTNISREVLAGKKPVANGCAFKLELLCHFYTGDIPVGLHRASFISGGFEAIIWAGISGTIGGFVPVLSSQDAKFLRRLEQQMRATIPATKNLAGRDHLAFRGYYAPPKQIIDGDLCELYSSLSAQEQKDVGEELDREPWEVERKLSDLRTRSVF